MASGTAGTTRTSAATDAGSSAELAGEQLIERQLAVARRHVKGIEIGVRLLLGAVATLVYLLLAVLIDHWLFDLGLVGRWLALVILVGGAAWYLARHVVAVALRTINPLYVARVIEEVTPSLQNSLINYLFLRPERKTIHESIYRAIQQRAARDVGQLEVEATIDHSPVFRLAYVLLAVVALAGAYKVFSPKDPLPTVRRVLTPWASIGRPARVQILDLSPGDAQAYQGDALAISARVVGLASDEKVELVYSTEDGQTVERRLVMPAAADGRTWQGQLPPESSGLQQNVAYRIVAGDAASPTYRVTVSPAPLIAVERVEYDYPAYMARPRRVLERQGDLSAWEGTRVTVVAQANQPIQKAWIEFEPATTDGPDAAVAALAARTGPATADRVMHMTVDGKTARQTFYLDLTPDRRQAKNAAYVVRFLTVDGQRNARPVVYRIEVLPDVPPEVEITKPAEERATTPADGELKIDVRALDPDFALSRLAIAGRMSGETVFERELLEDVQGAVGPVVRTWTLKPADLELKEGDVVSITAVAADNRAAAPSFAPSPNVRRSRELWVEITAAARRTDPPRDDQPGEGSEKQDDAQEENKKPSDKASAADSPDSAGKDSAAKDSAAPDKSRTKPDEQPRQGEKGSEQGKKEGRNEGNEGGDKPSDKPSRKPNEQGGEQPGEKPGKKPGEKPSEKPGEKPPMNSPQQGGGSSSDQQQGAKPNEKPMGGQGGASSKDAASDSSEGGAQDGTEGGGEGGRDSGSANGAKQEGGSSKSQGSRPNDGAAKPSDVPADGSESTAGGEPGGEGAAGGTRQPLDDGDVFERALEHLRKQQEQQGKSSNSPGSAGASPRTDGGSATRAKPEEGVSPGAEKPENGQTGKPEGKPTGEQPDRKSQGAGKPNDAASSGTQSGKPLGPAETKPDESPPQTQTTESKQLGSEGKNGESGAGEQSKQERSAPAPMKETADRPKNQSPDNARPSDSPEPPAPSMSKRQSDSKGGVQGDQSGGGKRGGGQGAKQAGNDSAGNSTSADEGAGASPEKGAGEQTGRPGEQAPAPKPTGNPGDQRGPGSGSAPGVGSNNAQPNDPQGKPGGDGKPGDKPQGKSPDAPATGTGGGAAASAGGGIPSDTSNRRLSQGGAAAEGDEGNAEYARRATDLVLDHLRQQADNPDAELLRQLGWTADDLRQFVAKWQALKQAAQENDPNAQRELNESLRSLGLRPTADRRRAAQAAADAQRDNRDAGARSNPPTRYLDRFNAFRRGTAAP